MYRNRGRVLLAVQVHSMVWTFLLAAPLGFWASRIVLFYSRLLLGHPSIRFLDMLPIITMPMAVFPLYFLLPRIKFYEQGVEFPSTLYGGPARYLRWDQIERTSRDGNRLILTGKRSVLGSEPVQAGAARIPNAQHAAVDEVLAKMLGRQ